MKKTTFKKTIFTSFVILFLAFPFIAQAQCYIDVTNICYIVYSSDTNIDNTGIDGMGLGHGPTANICCLIQNLANILYVFGIGLAVAVIIIAGIMYLTSGGDTSRVDKAKKTLTYGLIGAVIIILAGFILGLLREVIINQLIIGI